MERKPDKSLHDRLEQKGVAICNAESVHIDKSVDPDRIEPGVVIHAGSRIRGKNTFLCGGAVIGLEAPATIEDCRVGPGVSLKGGFFKSAVFLQGASVGSGGHVREGTIFEEYASAAHTVGVKQTILFPFVTLGSLVNFCDCLMAGGTGPKNHSEVGSSYIHFNFTPQQDKVTPSLLGDVPAGVMLDQQPVFLGGQGGLVGPVRLAFGTVTAAGTICRKNEMRPGRLIFGGASKGGSIAYQQAYYPTIKATLRQNLNYIANLIALGCWYRHVRSRFVSKNMPPELFEGLVETIDAAIRERVSRMAAFAGKMAASAEAYEKSAGKEASEKLLAQKRELYRNRNYLEDLVLREAEKQAENDPLDPPAERFLAAVARAVDRHGKTDYVRTIQHLDKKNAEIGTAWLQGVVDASVENWLRALPAFSD